jgi:glycosyltransferase involved in cell wall biosynthesis
MTVTVALIPAHNEVLTIRAIVEAVAGHVDTVLVIDDGSTDGTAEALTGAPVHLVRHASNAGKGARLVEGLRLAGETGATQVITLDADGQHDPEMIPAFLASARVNPGAFILGDRSGDTAHMPRSRVFGNRFGSFFVSWACARRLRDAQCGMRLYPLGVWRTVAVPTHLIDGFLFETAVLLYAAEADVPFVTLPIASRYDGFVHRPSHFKPIRDFMKLAGMVARFLCSRRLRLRGLFVQFAAD